MRRVELPTCFVAATIYGGWLLLTWYHHAIPLAISAPLTAWLLAWHGSLQHETIHGHPTASRTINRLIAALPLSLWLPYAIYEETHLLHHRTSVLTDPIDDPESAYVAPERWQRMSQLFRALHWALSTLAGRLLLGPIVRIVELFVNEVRRFARKDTSHLGPWLVHLGACAVVLAWVVIICEIPLWLYLVAFVYPGLSLTLLRSFTEHRPAPDRSRATAIVEAGPFLSLLFLNNNLHALHHDRPDVPWYLLPLQYREKRDDILATNGGFFFSGYGEIARRFFLTPKDAPVVSKKG